jgi:microcystin-dependent protein
VGTSIDVRGFLAPTNYAFTYGQAVSRTTFAALFSALTSAQSGTISNGNPTITGLTDTTQFGKGMAVESVGIPAGATILSCTSTTCTLSANATTGRTGTMTFFAYGNGDGSTTFNLPDDRGKILVTRDNLGGTAANITQLSPTLTTTSTSTSATVSSATGLQLGMFVINANTVPGTTITAISGTTITLSVAASGSAIAAAARFSVFPDPQALGSSIASIGGALATANLPAYTPSGTI